MSLKAISCFFLAPLTNHSSSYWVSWWIKANSTKVFFNKCSIRCFSTANIIHSICICMYFFPKKTFYQKITVHSYTIISPTTKWNCKFVTSTSEVEFCEEKNKVQNKRSTSSPPPPVWGAAAPSCSSPSSLSSPRWWQCDWTLASVSASSHMTPHRSCGSAECWGGIRLAVLVRGHCLKTVQTNAFTLPVKFWHTQRFCTLACCLPNP